MPIDFRTQLEENLKRKLPEFQRGNVALDEYLETAGKFLDELRDAIDRIKFSKDYENSSIQQLTEYAEEIKVEFPSDIADETLRLAVRDIVSIYRFKGTEKTLRWIFDVIGLPINIRYAWVLNPNEFSPPVPTEVGSETFIYGNERVYENGTYFTGEDIFGNSYNKIPILGERYPKNKRLTEHQVLKTPYMFINIDSSDYDDFIEDIDTEDQTLLDEIIKDYFDEIRPANVALVVIITIPEFEDQIPYEENFDEFDIESIESPIINGTWGIGASITNPYRFYEHYKMSIGPDKEYIEFRETFERIENLTFSRSFDSNSEQIRIHLRSNSLAKFNVTINEGSILIKTTDISRLETEGDISNELNTFEELSSSGTYEFAFIGKTVLSIETTSDFDGSGDFDIHYISPLIKAIPSYIMNFEFERNSDAKYVDSNGIIQIQDDNKLRQTYNPYTNEFLGYLVESERENKILYSELLTNSVWDRYENGEVLASVNEDSPDTLSNFYRVFRDEGSSVFSGLRQTVPNITQGVKHTISMFAKPGSQNVMTFAVEQGDSFTVVEFDTNTVGIQEVSAPAFNNRLVYFERYPNNVYRLFFEFDSRNDETEMNIYLLADYNGTTENNHTLFWGVQLEEGTGTSYIANFDEYETRSEDKLLIPNLREELAATPNGNDLLFFADFSVFSTNGESSVMYLQGGDNETISLVVSENSIQFESSLFDSIETETLIFNENRTETVDHKIMLKLHAIDETSMEYTFFYNGEIVGSEVGGRLSIPVEAELAKNFNGMIHNLYFSPMDSVDILNNKYTDILEEYRVD